MKYKPGTIIHLEPGEELSDYPKLQPVEDRHIEEFKALITRFNSQAGNDLFLILKQLYAFITRFNKDFLSTFTSCNKGCNYCCHMDIHLTILEADYIRTETNIPAQIMPLTTGNTSACPFLSVQGICSIYQFRLLLCRTYHVLSNPALCADPNAQVMQYGAHSANMGNWIYKKSAEWIYFQVMQLQG